MAKVNLKKAPLNEVAEFVWAHWQDTDRALVRALDKLSKVDDATKQSGAVALQLEAPLVAHHQVTVPQMRQSLAIKASEASGDDRSQNEKEQERYVLLSYLEQSEKARAQAHEVLKALA